MKPLKAVCTLGIQFWGSANLYSVTLTQCVNHLAMVACQSFQVCVHYQYQRLWHLGPWLDSISQCTFVKTSALITSSWLWLPSKGQIHPHFPFRQSLLLGCQNVNCHLQLMWDAQHLIHHLSPCTFTVSLICTSEPPLQLTRCPQHDGDALWSHLQESQISFKPTKKAA